MIWSIVPEEVIFGDTETSPLTVVNYLGRRVVMRSGQITTLLSTDPYDYLDSRLAPGSFLSDK